MDSLHRLPNLQLNKDIDLDKVKAQMNHGLLTITLPKRR